MVIHEISVIGANGTIGSQVAGLLAAFCQTKVYLVCRTLEKAIKSKELAIKSVRSDSISSLLVPSTYQDLEKCISSSDWVFESVSEDFNTKKETHLLISKYRKPGTLVSTGTSGLSVESLAEIYDDEGRSLFFGTHFFNPPYNLPFLEFVTTKWTDYSVSDAFFNYLEQTVLRKAIHVKDRAAFLGNRIGFIFLNEVAQFAELYKDRGGIDYMDAILGPFTGRAMAPLATVDFVGIDTHKAIVEHLHSLEPDFFGSECIVPPYIEKLVKEGCLGRKTGGGFFKHEFDINSKVRELVYDISSDCYRSPIQFDFPYARQMVSFISDGLYQEAIDAMLNDASDEARICKYFLAKYIMCSYESAKQVSDNIADADIAMSYGFNWVPPSSLCFLFGKRKGIERLIKEDERIGQSFRGFDLSLLDEQVRQTDIDYRRYFKASM